MLLPYYQKDRIEAGCDEAGRGCLAGSVFAAAVILPKDYSNKELNDSKQLSEKKRNRLRVEIVSEAIAWQVASLDNLVIDEINILNASIQAMHLAVRRLNPQPEFLLIDGNRFKPFATIPHQCFVGGDGKFLSIAAASVLAKTFRDEFIVEAHETYPEYNWLRNKGYATKDHRTAILKYGRCPLHRITFRLKEEQLRMEF